jgi:hypothetical protein
VTDIGSPRLKLIEYRGGLATFRVPADWLGEYEDAGGATFYADEPDSGALRLNVLTFEAPSRPSAADLLRAVEGPRRTAELLPTGNALATYAEDATEDGVPLQLFYWEVANGVDPSHVRLAVFSYTVLRERRDLPEVAAEIAMLDREIRRTAFAADLGDLS